jgi:capsular exopolysaccharide synthesis family protein
MKLLRKHIAWLLLATVAGIAGAMAIHVSVAPSYTSAAEVDVEPNLPALTIEYTPNMVTEQDVATSGVVLANAAQALGTTSTALEKDLSATVSGTNATGGTANVLSISCSMRTASSAQRCAAAAANAYMAYRNDTSDSAKTRAHDPMIVTLVTPATLPSSPAGVSAKILLPVGAILGLLLGIGAIFARDFSDHRVRDGADLERLLGAPVLAVIPRAQGSDNVFIKQPLSATAESYRYLRELLSPLITSAPGGGAMLLITSAQADDGCTSVAANLAAALAEPGAKVLLVDADLSHPPLGGVFNTGRRPGWSDLLAKRASLDEVAVPVPGVAGLRLVTAGDVAIRPAEIFRDTRLAQAFLDMRAQADVIVVDSAPVLEASHTMALARASDIVTIVADVRRTNREDVSAAVQQIRAIGSRVIIGALNGAASPVNGLARAAPAAHEGSVSSASEVPAILAAAVPLRGANGHHQESFGTAQVNPGGRDDRGTDADDSSGS